jgi:hypothetical protein
VETIIASMMPTEKIEEALAAGRESDINERMMLDDG